MPSAQFESSPPYSHYRTHAKSLLSTRPSRSTGSMAINPDLLFILSEALTRQGTSLWHCRGYITGQKGREARRVVRQDSTEPELNSEIYRVNNRALIYDFLR